MSLSLATRVIAVGSFLFAGLLFVSIAGAIELGTLVNSYALGFLLIGLIYFIFSIIIYMLRSKLNVIIIKKIGLKFFN
jgi:hypothetical protein